MKITVICTAKGNAWGGNEELWFDMINTLDTKHKCSVYRYFNNKFPHKLLELTSKGVLQHKIPTYHILINRIILIFKHQIPFLYNIFSPIVKNLNFFNSAKNSDIIIINQGGIYEILDDVFLSSFIEQNKGKNIFLICHWNTDYGRPYFLDYTKANILFKCFKSVFFVSHRNKQTTARQIISKLSNAHVIKNPINRQNNTLIPYPKIEENYIFACVGRLDINFKGQDILIELLSSDKWLHRNWELHIYGAGRDKDYLSELITFYNLEQKIILKGYCDVDKIWASSHILIIPSLSEGLPLVLIEAMICSRIAIVTHIAGMPDLIQDGINGFIASSPKDIFLDIALEKAWQVKESWKEMGLKARTTALGYSEKNAGQKLFEKINQIIEDE